MFRPHAAPAALILGLVFLGATDVRAARPTEAQIQTWLSQLSTSGSSADTREEAVDGLARVDDPRAYDALVGASGDPAWDVRGSAVRGLGRWADDISRRDEVARIAVAAFGDSHYMVRNAASSTASDLARRGHPTIGASVLAVLQNASSPGREDAAAALGRMRYAPAVPTLISVSGSSADRNTRSAAVRALGSLVSERHAHDMRTPLLRALTDGDYLVRDAAQSSIRYLERAGDTQVIPGVLALLDRPDSSIFVNAVADVLSRTSDARAIPGLLRLVSHSRWEVRSAALRGFENHAGDPRVFEPTLAALGDASSSVRDRAIRALEDILEERYDSLRRDEKLRALTMLATLLGDPERYTRRRAAELLGRYLRRHLATVADDSELERRVRACFPSVDAVPRSSVGSTHSSVVYLLDVLLFGGVPVLTVVDAADHGGGRAPASPSSEVPRWSSTDIRAFQELLGELVR